MKLMLGTTELADVPDDVARQLIAVFAKPGHLTEMPTVTPLATREVIRPLEGSRLAYFGEEQGADVAFSVRATNETPGRLGDYERVLRETVGAALAV